MEPLKGTSTLSVDLGLMAMKGYFTLPRSPEMESHYQMQLSVIPRTPFSDGGLTSLLYMQSTYSKIH